MHELALTQSIVAIVAEAAHGRRVVRVALDVGKLSGVDARAIAFCFDVVIKGSPLEGATLDLREIEGRARCRRCGAEVAIAALWEPCACGSHDLEQLQGGELKVKEMEVEDPAPP